MIALYRDRTGARIDFETWLAHRIDQAYSRVAATTFEDGTWVSTVWLGTPGAMFETAIFAGGPHGEAGAGRVVTIDRYTTEAEAAAGHAAMVEAYRRGGFTEKAAADAATEDL